MCHCVAPAPASAAFLDLNDEDSNVDFTSPVAAVLEVPEGQMLDLNKDNGDDDDDVSDYYTITTYCQNGLRINGSCQSCGAPERASCVCLFQDLRHSTCRTLKRQMNRFKFRCPYHKASMSRRAPPEAPPSATCPLAVAPPCCRVAPLERFLP